MKKLTLVAEFLSSLGLHCSLLLLSGELYVQAGGSLQNLLNYMHELRVNQQLLCHI